MLNFLKKKKKEETVNYLELTPYPLYEHTEKDNGLIDVLVPKFKNPFMKKLTNGIKDPYIKANLDEFGAETWKLMNGENRVGEIAEKLVEKFGEGIQPVYERLTMFLTQLYRNDFISFNELKGNENGKSSSGN